MIRVYGASKLSHAPLWLSLRDEPNWGFVDWTARWPVKHVGTIPDIPCFANIFWQHDEEDVKRSHVVLVYAEESDNLRGALVEAGMAIASGIGVITCGENLNFGTWQYHPSVLRTDTLEQARLLLEMLNDDLEAGRCQ